MQRSTTSPRPSMETNGHAPGHVNRTVTAPSLDQKKQLLFRFIGLASGLWVILGLFEAVNARPFLSVSDFALFAVLLGASLVGRSGRSEFAVNATFWGSVVIIAFAWVFTSSPGKVSQDASAIVVASASTMSLILMGMYAARRYQIDIMLAIAVAANLLWIVRDDFDTVEWIHLLVAYSAVLFLCYLAARLALRTSKRLEDDYAAIDALNKELERTHFAEGRAHAALADSVAKFCHDVRSPLTVSMSVIEQVEKTNQPERKKRFFEMLKQSQKSILRLVEFGLEGYRQEAEAFDEMLSVDVGRFLSEIADLHQASITGGGPRIEVRVPEPSPAVDVPLTGLTRVMDNLVQNALKYTRTGPVVLSAELVQPNADSEEFDLKISVADNGIGMSAERLEKVRKGLNGPDPNIPSSRGIGLASCRSVLAVYRGALHIESRDGEGTEVTVTIPVGLHAEREAKEAPRIKTEGVTFGKHTGTRST